MLYIERLCTIPARNDPGVSRANGHSGEISHRITLLEHYLQVYLSFSHRDHSARGNIGMFTA